MSVQLGAYDVVLSNNVLDGGGEYSVYDSWNVQIIGNKIIKSNSAGIEINDNLQIDSPTAYDAYNIIVADNVIQDAAASGIYTSANDVLIRGNIITGAASNGIKVAEVARRVNAYNNIIRDCAAQTAIYSGGAIDASSSATWFTLTVTDATGMTAGMSIAVAGAGVSGAFLNSTISSISGNTITLSSRSYTTVSGATVYTNYGYGGVRLGNGTDASPGDVDCFWDNNTIIETRTSKKHAYGIRLDGPMSGITFRNNKVDGYVEYPFQTNFVSSGLNTINVSGNSWQVPDVNSTTSRTLSSVNVGDLIYTGNADTTWTLPIFNLASNGIVYRIYNASAYTLKLQSGDLVNQLMVMPSADTGSTSVSTSTALTLATAKIPKFTIPRNGYLEVMSVYVSGGTSFWLVRNNVGSIAAVPLA